MKNIAAPIPRDNANPGTKTIRSRSNTTKFSIIIQDAIPAKIEIAKYLKIGFNSNIKNLARLTLYPAKIVIGSVGFKI